LYSDMLNEGGGSTAFSLFNELPLEILLYIIQKFISYKTAIALQQTSTSMYNICLSNEVRLEHHLNIARTHPNWWYVHYIEDNERGKTQIQELWAMLETYPVTSSLFQQAFQLLQRYLQASRVSLSLPISAELEKKFHSLIQSLPFEAWWVPSLLVLNYAKTHITLLPAWFGVEEPEEKSEMLTFLQDNSPLPLLESVILLFNVNARTLLYSYLSIEKMILTGALTDEAISEDEQAQPIQALMLFAQQIRVEALIKLMKRRELNTLYLLLSQSPTSTSFLGQYFRQLYPVALEQDNMDLVTWLLHGLNTHPQQLTILNEIFAQAVYKGCVNIVENLQVDYTQRLEKVCALTLAQAKLFDLDALAKSSVFCTLAEGYGYAIESAISAKQLGMYTRLTNRCPPLISQAVIDWGCIAAVRAGLVSLAWTQLDKGANINRCYHLLPGVSGLSRPDNLFSKAEKNHFMGSQNALIAAAAEGNTGLLQLLVLEGAQVKLHNDQQQAALSYAIQSGKVDAVKWLISKGANIHLRDIEGATPLIHAVKASNACFFQYETWEVEIEENADIEMTAIVERRAHYHNSIEAYGRMIDILLEQGANINEADDLGNTPLMYAAIQKNKPAVSLLLDKGADASLVNHDGENALLHWLHWTPTDYSDAWNLENINEELAFIARLIDKGASIHQQDKRHHFSVLHVAAKAGATQVMAYLLQQGAKASLEDAHGNTILHLAVSNQRLRTVQYLISHGVSNMHQRNLQGNTPLHLVFADLYPEDYEMIHYLLENAGEAIHLHNAAGHTIRDLLEGYKDVFEEEIYTRWQEEIRHYGGDLASDNTQH
jgi:ankyrin repeat protein